MKNKKQYKIESLRDILSGFRLPHIGAFNFFKTMTESSKKSKMNFLLQFINFVIIWLFIFIILPDRTGYWFSPYVELQLFFLPAGQIVVAVVSYVLIQTVLSFFSLSWSDIFMTSFKMTILVLTGLLSLIFIFFTKLFIIFARRLKQDLIL